MTTKMNKIQDQLMPAEDSANIARDSGIGRHEQDDDEQEQDIVISRFEMKIKKATKTEGGKGKIVNNKVWEKSVAEISGSWMTWTRTDLLARSKTSSRFCLPASQLNQPINQQTSQESECVPFGAGQDGA